LFSGKDHPLKVLPLKMDFVSTSWASALMKKEQTNRAINNFLILCEGSSLLIHRQSKDKNFWLFIRFIIIPNLYFKCFLWIKDQKLVDIRLGETYIFQKKDKFLK